MANPFILFEVRLMFQMADFHVSNNLFSDSLFSTQPYKATPKYLPIHPHACDSA